MKLDSELIKKLQDISKKSGGYLTTDLFDKNRDDLPTWDTLKKKLDIDFSELLKLAKIPSRDEFNLNKNRIKAISNFKIIYLEHGYVSTKLYDDLKYHPSSDYIGKKYGWANIAKDANVKLTNNKYTSLEEMILELKTNIKKLGYIPTLKEYEELSIKPSRKSFAAQELQWSEAMNKAGYKLSSKPSKARDNVCSSDDCFRQFSPSNPNEKYCEMCFKDLRAKLISELENLNIDELRDIIKKLIYTSKSQKTVLDALRIV